MSSTKNYPNRSWTLLNAERWALSSCAIRCGWPPSISLDSALRRSMRTRTLAPLSIPGKSQVFQVPIQMLSIRSYITQLWSESLSGPKNFLNHDHRIRSPELLSDSAISWGMYRSGYYARGRASPCWFLVIFLYILAFFAVLFWKHLVVWDQDNRKDLCNVTGGTWQSLGQFPKALEHVWLAFEVQKKTKPLTLRLSSRWNFY